MMCVELPAYKEGHIVSKMFPKVKFKMPFYYKRNYTYINLKNGCPWNWIFLDY